MGKGVSVMEKLTTVFNPFPSSTYVFKCIALDALLALNCLSVCRNASMEGSMGEDGLGQTWKYSELCDLSECFPNLSAP